jgi:hypothetical protein
MSAYIFDTYTMTLCVPMISFAQKDDFAQDKVKAGP